MARSFGVQLDPPLDQSDSVRGRIDHDPYTASNAQELIDAWLPLTFALSSLNRCMGQSDMYPFVLSPPIFQKLDFIHE